MIFATLCIASIITASGLAAYHISMVEEKDQQIADLCTEITALNEKISDLNITMLSATNTITQKNNLIAQKNNEITGLNNQIAELEEEIGQPTNQAMLVIDEVNIEDLRLSIPYALHINCRVINTGDGTAYNAFLHIFAFNSEGVAIDTYHSFGGITAGVSVGLDFSVEYSGSPIENWQITPVWTNQFIIPISGTLPS